MKITKILNYGIIAAVVVSTLSFFIKLIPCKTAPVIAKPEYKWAFCKLPNPFGEQLVGTSTKFFGLSTDPLAALIFLFLAVLLVVFVILSITKKKQGKVVDFTEKKKYRR